MSLSYWDWKQIQIMLQKQIKANAELIIFKKHSSKNKVCLSEMQKSFYKTCFHAQLREEKNMYAIHEFSKFNKK